MSAAQAYYDQVLSMGHSHENALAHTRQHYPNFVPGIAEAVAAPSDDPRFPTGYSCCTERRLTRHDRGTCGRCSHGTCCCSCGNGSQRVRSSSLHPAAGRGVQHQ